MESWRLPLEQTEMNRRFPQFSLIKLRTGDLAWEGMVSTQFGHGYHIVAVYPADYPYSAPRIYPINSVPDVNNECDEKVKVVVCDSLSNG